MLVRGGALMGAQSRCTTFIIDVDKHPLHDVGRRCEWVFQCVRVYFWVVTAVGPYKGGYTCLHVCVCLNNGGGRASTANLSSYSLTSHPCVVPSNCSTHVWYRHTRICLLSCV